MVLFLLPRSQFRFRIFAMQVSELVLHYLDASKRAAQSSAATREALKSAEEQRQAQHAATLAAEQALRTESERREALESTHKTEVKDSLVYCNVGVL